MIGFPLQNLHLKLRYFLSISLLLVGMVSCSQVEPPREKINEGLLVSIEQKPARPSELRIDISTSTQMGKLSKGDETVAIFPVSTGKEGHSTPYGNFMIFNKEKENRSSLYGSIYDAAGEMVVPYADSRKHKVPKGGRFEGAPMPYTMHFTGYCAFHEGEVPYQPRKTSHGCIHLTPRMAELLFRVCPLGTPVRVSF